MRALVALLVVLLAGSVFSDPSGSCWLVNPDGVQYDVGNPDIYYQLMQMRLCFINATYHNLTWTMTVSAKGYPSKALNPVTATGMYFFEAPQSIIFSYAGENACQETQTYCCNLCPLVMERFAGKYGFEATPSLSSPTTISITPDSVPRGGASSAVPMPYQWGDLDVALPLACNTTSCGSFSGLVPNPYQGGSVSYSVRRFPLSERSSPLSL